MKANALFLLSLIRVSYCSTVDTIIDIGHALSPDDPAYPFKWIQPFKLEVVYRGFRKYGWFAMNRFTYITYAGTDFEAPFISFETGWKVHEVPQAHLFGKVSVIDISKKAEEDPNYHMSEQDVDDWMSLYGPFPNNSVILVRTGWDARYGDQESYFGVQPNLTFPTIGEDAARRIIDFARDHNLNIYGIGIDSGHVDKYGEGYTVHQLVASKNMYILQNLKDLHLVPPTGARIIVAPTKVRGASGVPTRVMIRLPPTRKNYS